LGGDVFPVDLVVGIEILGVTGFPGHQRIASPGGRSIVEIMIVQPRSI
jgi:hypothetical protein